MKRRDAISIGRVKTLFRTLPIFESLPVRSLERLIRTGRVESLGAGQTLFEVGDPSDRFHVILQGALEILREVPGRPKPMPTAYLTPGEVIGGLSLLTGTARRCSGRIPESLVTWTLARGPFEAFARATPGYWQQFARALALRLEVMVADENGLGTHKDLSGRLAYFDLPTVIQTLVTSRQSGLLSLVGDEDRPFAQVLLVEGEVERARCGDLDGEDAFLEILLAGFDGQFHFRTIEEPDRDSVGRLPMIRATMNLLMDAARTADERAAPSENEPEPDPADASDAS